MEEIFQSLAEELNSDLEIKYEPSFSKLITFSPFTDDNSGIRTKSLQLKVKYLDQLIIVTNQTGDEKRGELFCKVNLQCQIPDFSISTRSHYLTLFKPNLNTLKILCDDLEFKKYIRQTVNEHNIENIAKNSQFFPKMIGNQKSNYEISVKYSLIFSKKKEVVKPLIEFYKSLIDYLFINYESTN